MLFFTYSVNIKSALYFIISYENLFHEPNIITILLREGKNTFNSGRSFLKS